MTMLTLHFGHVLEKNLLRETLLLYQSYVDRRLCRNGGRASINSLRVSYEETLRISAASLVAQRSANPIASQKENEFVARSEIERKKIPYEKTAPFPIRFL
jgi:hypothetical protein